jgi:hypothetical protein
MPLAPAPMMRMVDITNNPLQLILFLFKHIFAGLTRVQGRATMAKNSIPKGGSA